MEKKVSWEDTVVWNEARERDIKEFHERHVQVKFADMPIGNWSAILNFISDRSYSGRAKIIMFSLVVFVWIFMCAVKFSILACFIALTWKWING